MIQIAKNFKNVLTAKRNNHGLFFQLSFLTLFAVLILFSGQTLAQQNVCTPTTTVTEGDLSPGGIVSFGVSSGPGSVTVDHVNAGTGLQSLTVVGTPMNATIVIPPFTPGTTAPVTVMFTPIIPGMGVDFTLRAASTFHAAFIRVRCPDTCTPTTTITEGDLAPGGIASFGVMSGPGTVTVDHVNAGTGLQSLTVVGTPTNAVVMIPAFTPGTTAPVTVTFFVPNPSMPVDFTLRAASTFHAIFIRVRCGIVPTPTPTPTPTPPPCSMEGSLDPTFDNDGSLTTDFGTINDQAFAVAVQPDGKIIAAGSGGDNFALARYNSNGSLDTSFDIDGKVTTNFGSIIARAQAIVLQPDGKIVVAGSTTSNQSDFALARYNPDGSLDTSFDTDGKVTTDFLAKDDVAEAVALQSDGKIVVAGFATVPGNIRKFALARYNPNGSLDTSFETDGKVIPAFGSGNETAHAVAVQTDGKIVAAGIANQDFALVRLNQDGTLDTSFDTDGKVTTDFDSGFDQAYAIALQPDGKIIATGRAIIGSTTDFALARYNSNGSLDTSFDTDGKVTTPFGSSNENAQAIALQADGKIVVAGYAALNSFDIALARYNPNGSLDTSFDIDGKVTFDSGSDFAFGVAVQPDGKIVVAGSLQIGFDPVLNSDFRLIRYGNCPTVIPKPKNRRLK